MAERCKQRSTLSVFNQRYTTQVQRTLLCYLGSYSIPSTEQLKRRKGRYKSNGVVRTELENTDQPKYLYMCHPGPHTELQTTYTQ